VYVISFISLAYALYMSNLCLIYTQLDLAGSNTLNRLSSINGCICQIDVNEGEMCGYLFNAQPALQRHLRNSHPGASM
jgi:hypothetical protein